MGRHKYNYYDDDPIIEDVGDDNDGKSSDIPKDKSAKAFALKLRKAGDKAVEFAQTHIYSPNELERYPYLRRLIYKSLAVVLAVIIIAVCIFAFSHSLKAKNEANERFCKDAGSVCTDYISEYGASSYESIDSKYGKNLARLTGLAYARRMDFNHDGQDELMVCYLDSGVYYIDIWGYKGEDFMRLYSHEVSSDNGNIKGGSWITFYNKHNKYYVCQSESDKPSAVTLYEFKGDEFKKQKTCKYNVDTSVYSIDGNDDTKNFERIELSFIRRGRAEIVSDIVTENISEFETQTVAQIDESKTPEQLKQDAYYEIVEKYNTKYGTAQYKKDGGYSYIDGLAVVKLIDFDGDSNDELLLVYRKEIKTRRQDAYNNNYISVVEPIYCAEVYSWNGTKATSIFTKDRISTLFRDYETLDDENTTDFFITEKVGDKTNFCNNTYSYNGQSVYTATSRRYTLKKGEFSSTYNSRIEYEYGYKTFYIDDERQYSTSFSMKGYEIPYFCNNDSYNKNKFTLTYVSGDSKKADQIKQQINETVTTVKTLNNQYSPAV